MSLSSSSGWQFQKILGKLLNNFIYNNIFYRAGRFIGAVLKQFRFNVYIRFYMLTYFDLTFFAVMKYVEGNTST